MDGETPPPPPPTSPPPPAPAPSPPPAEPSSPPPPQEQPAEAISPPPPPPEEKREEKKETKEKDVDEAEKTTEEHADISKKKSKEREKLPTKATDFQVRVRIIEGRQLSGGNISPVVRVTVENQSRQTRVKKSTNKPLYDEIFFFNFHMNPNELLDSMVNFEVFNSRKLRANAMIGSFECDVGFFYDEPSHAVIRKWILLTDPTDKMAGAKGYIKVTVMVLGPGDEAPAVTVDADQDDADDIEDNLIQAPGVMLRQAVFDLRVFLAEDIPQMDSAFGESMKKLVGSSSSETPKELVDPYIVFSFAGKECKTKTFVNCDHPEFNQELHVQFKFPTMCERIKLQMFDWDKIGSDECIGTFFLPIADISGHGDEGFLPRMGPCFVNFYGSTREFSELPNEYEKLNLGIGEGVAYRGRALISLQTKMDEEMEEPVEDLQSDQIVHVQPYLRRRKYKLFACFLEATMVATVDRPVQFEISIGNYGNKLDEFVPPSSSTTSPVNAVFDGCFYYYLPWGEIKPCCSVDSHWEDIAFRLDPLNILSNIYEQLEEHLEKVKLFVIEKRPIQTIAYGIIFMLDQLISKCKEPLPEVTSKTPGVNDLDLKLYERRIAELKCIVEEAQKLRDNATDIDEALSSTEDFVKQLKMLAIEPQNSMPDVVIWMLSGTNRIAYHRVPAYRFLHSQHARAMGNYCGKEVSFFMKYPGHKQDKVDDHPEIPANVRVMVWLGLEQHQEAWTNRDNVEGDFCVYAETYENQMNFMGSWTHKGLSRPHWSDIKGDLKLPQSAFNPPSGWSWEGDWFVNPEHSVSYDRDQGYKSFLEDVFENQVRQPGLAWEPASTDWTDIHNNELAHKDEITAPEGWEWTWSEWSVDLNRAVDEDGFEYSVDETVANYVAVEKTYHLSRRRRWVRKRKLIKEQADTETKKETEGWEFAKVFSAKFHSKEKKTDLVRRRRWHRKLIQEDPTASVTFVIDTRSEKEKEKRDTKSKPKKGKNFSVIVPSMFITFEKPHKYQLRAYIFQGRNLLPADSDGLSDPYARVSFSTQSQVTSIIHSTLCPTWDQTLIFDDIVLYGGVDFVEDSPPNVIIELFDEDAVGKDDFMGRCVVKPTVKLHGQGPPAPKLLWHPVFKGKQEGGEILAAFELFLDEDTDLPFPPTKRGNYYIVPSGIRPVVQRTAIEVLCWGVRNMKRFQLTNVSSPNIEFECGGKTISSSVIKNTQKNPNFDQPLFFFDTWLPKEELYAPPMNIKVRDNRSFGRHPIVGVHVIKSLTPYKCEPLEPEPMDELDADGISETEQARGSFVIEIGEEKPKMASDDDDIDWWSKFYTSIGDMEKAGEYPDKGYDTIMVYDKPLEDSEHYEGFHDFVSTYNFYRGKVKEAEEEATPVGEFKGMFCVYPLPADPSEPLPPRVFKNLPPSTPVECLIRVYVVRAIDLQPMDPNGLADPYLIVKLGKQKLSEQSNYIANTLNPVFGKSFDLTAFIPITKDLNITVMDYDLVGFDDLIGETVIDLENRYLSSYRATCGLPATYCISGPNKWRDSQTPKEILAAHCVKKNLRPPKYIGTTRMILDDAEFLLDDFEEGMTKHPHLGPPDERLALHVLNCQALLPEHVETRPLFNSLQPGVEQGKLQLWVDIFPKDIGPPGPPFDVSPRQPIEMELRIIIWNTSDVILDDVSIMGEAMSDIYVKGWIVGIDEQQKTDVHYRSLDGTGNFNWRFLFPFLYIRAEKVMVLRKKAHFWSLDKTEQMVPPRLMIQIWDNDLFSPDDFLGRLELNLNKMPTAAKNSKKCGLHQLIDTVGDKKKKKKSSEQAETVSLFEMKTVYGWWPVASMEDGEPELTGKVEMTLELLTKEETELKPAGRARNDPNMNPTLEPPNRPATSFSWFTSPFKSLRYVLWRKFKWYIIGFLVIFCLVALLVLFFYSMPGYTVKKIFGV